jgi:hypothetical protein
MRRHPLGGVDQKRRCAGSFGGVDQNCRGAGAFGGVPDPARPGLG